MNSEEWIERLRVWAAVAVIALHVSGFPFRAYEGTPTWSWMLANVWNSGTRWAVPVYVILSGYLLLDVARRERPVQFWRRRLARIGLPLLFWGTVYALWNGARTVSDLVRSLLGPDDAAYHLWFLYMLVVLYAAAPLLRTLLARLTPIGGTLLCAGCFALTLHVPGIAPRLRAEALPGWLGVAAPFVGYFLFGGLLRRWPRGNILLPALAAAASLVVTVAGMVVLARHHGSLASRAFQEAASPNVIVLAGSLCVLARNAGNRFPGERLQRFAPAVLGVYLVHPLVLDVLWMAGLSIERFPWWLAVPVLTGLVAAGSLAVVLLLRRVPILRRTV